MNDFFYFVPELGGARLWRELGLAYAFDGPPAQIEVDGDLGPDGRSGMVFTRSRSTGLPRPIVWHPSRCGRFWLGWHEPARPGPEHLWRNRSIGGNYLTLADGQPWLIPLVLPCTDRDPDRSSGLPSALRLDGELVQMAPLAEFEPLIEQARPFLAAALDEQALGVEEAQTLDYCAALLTVGYRVSLDEILALGLLTHEVVQEIVMLSIDGGPFDSELGVYVGERMQAAIGELVR